MNPLLTIVTGTWNRLPFLSAFMDSVRSQIPPGVSYNFSIADAGSTDGTIEYLKEQSDVNLIEQGELTGAIKAFNLAASQATGDFLLIGNDDIEIEPGSIMNGLAYMLQNPACGAGCFFQDRAGKAPHVEHMQTVFNGKGTQSPYVQVGLIPRWLWDHCGGWGDFGGRTYGGDNYISAKIYEAGYQITPIEGTMIHDKTPTDELRAINNTQNTDGERLWEKFPRGFVINTIPQIENPLKTLKRCVYAPIYEPGHEVVQKAQKKGLREALAKKYLVWEVDYMASHENIGDACEVWKPDLCLTQLHNACLDGSELGRMRKNSKYMVNWNGDQWEEQQLEPKSIEMLRYFDLQTGVNNSLAPMFKEKGIPYRFWPISFEPSILKQE